MKRTLITFLAVMFAAAGASAATIFVDIDKDSYLPGDQVIVTATLDVVGDEVVNAFGFINTNVIWDSSVASVANANGGFGTGTQNVIAGPGVGGANLTGGADQLSGSGTPTCSNNGNTCQIISQTNAGFSPISLDAQQLVAELILVVNAPAVPGTSVGLMFNADILGDGGAGLTVSARAAAGGTIVPEPTTGLMLGLGLLGLGFGGRRR